MINRSPRYSLAIYLACRLAIFVLVFGCANSAQATDFDTQVMPVLTRSGCNAGACHGAAVGRGGFKLSLLGSDPAADYESIVHALEGRRVHRSHPKQSLLLRKPSGELEHGGDVPLAEDSPGYQIVLNWLSEDVPRAGNRKLTGFRVSPDRWLVPANTDKFQIKCEASFNHGSWEDVTHLTSLSVTDPEAVVLDPIAANGFVKRPGQHVILARYLQQVVPMLVVRPFSEQAKAAIHPAHRQPAEPIPAYGRRSSPASFIDQHINRVLDELHIPAEDVIDDLTYLRRVTLDLTGRLPTADEVIRFDSSQAIDKRERLVDRLLASRAFVDYWTLAYAKLLRMHTLANEPPALEVYSSWLREAVATGLPWNQLTRQLLIATGDSHRVGPANFGRMVVDARAHAELVGNVMLGVRLGCANCHDHPLDKWTQDDYHGLAAVFARLDRGRHVQLLSRGEVTHPRTRQPAQPRIPGQRFIIENEDALTALAQWINNPSTGLLTRAHVNRLWSAMFGRGLIEAADDIRETNPASHPLLLDELSKNLVSHDYDLRQSLRVMVSSQTYARCESTTADAFYASAHRKALTPETLADAIADVTDVPHSFPDRQPGTRAVEMIDMRASAPVLDVLGRCTRPEACMETEERRAGLATQLHYLNGELINQRLIDPDGRLQRWIASGYSNAEIIDQFFRLALSRPASAEELAQWRLRLQATSMDERRMQLEDFLWSLLSSHQFQWNH